MKRRMFLAGTAAALATPSIVRSAGTGVLKFIPQSDVTCWIRSGPPLTSPGTTAS